MTTEAVRAIEQLRTGDHICTLYETQAEHLAVLSLFHQNGLAGGARCIHVADDSPIDAFLDALRGAGVDVDREVRRGALRVLAPEEVYLQKRVFDPDAVIAFWEEAVENALQAGFSGLYVTGDVTWVLEKAPGVERLGEYEAKIKRAISGSKMQAICCYNYRLLPADLLAAMFATHPRAIFGDNVLCIGSHAGSSSEEGLPAWGWLNSLLHQLRESEARAQKTVRLKEKLLEIMRAGIYTCDADGLITYFNQRAGQIWGREPKLNNAEDRYCGSFKLFSTDGSPIPHGQCWMGLALQNDQPYDSREIVIERPDGSRVTVLAHAHPFYDDTGKRTGAVNVLVDITDRKRSEEEIGKLNLDLQNSVNQLQTVLRVSPVGIGVAEDPECRMIRVNPAFARMMGISPDVNASKTATPEENLPFKVFKDGREVPGEELPLQVAAARGVDVSGEELDLVREDGKKLSAIVSAAPLLDDEGRPRGSVGAVLDITDRRRAEDALRKSEAELTDFVETATIGLHRVGPDGVIKWANRAELQMLGYAPEEYIGHHISKFHADQSVIEDILRRLGNGETLQNYEATLRAKDGSLRHVLIDSTVFWENGEFSHTRCFTRDYTERKQAEESLREADRRKDEFLGMLSHELRNALTPITHSVKLLRLQQADTDIQQQALNVLDRRVGTLSRLVDELLDASRATSGRIHLDLTDVDLNALVQWAAESFQPQMEELRHEFSVSLSDTPLWVRGDSTRLEQVVVNLLSNAARYTPEGGQVWLTVEQEGDQVLVRVKDAGIGIEPGLLPHVFELFRQGAVTLDRPQSGLGIGLTLAKSLVELHGGTLAVRSEGPGQGSEFIVGLPAAHPPEPQQDRPEEETSTEGAPEEASGPGRGSLRVLLVDDAEDSRRMFGRLLEMMGHQLRTAHDGPCALEAAMEFRPHVVLLDVGLPGMDGYEVAQRMRQEPALENTVLVAVTGYGRNGDRQRALEAGFDHHQVKPPDIDGLEQLLATIAENGAKT